MENQMQLYMVEECFEDEEKIIRLANEYQEFPKHNGIKFVLFLNPPEFAPVSLFSISKRIILAAAWHAGKQSEIWIS